MAIRPVPFQSNEDKILTNLVLDYGSMSNSCSKHENYWLEDNLKDSNMSPERTLNIPFGTKLTEKHITTYQISIAIKLCIAGPWCY